MARPRTPLLSRDGIVAAALALVDAEGLEALSTRRLAAELGVSGPSLYNHVATKDELIDAVVDSVLAGVDVSAFAGLAAGDGGGMLADVADGAAPTPTPPAPAATPTPTPRPASAPAALEVVAELPAPGPAWRGALATWARSYREALAAHPQVAQRCRQRAQIRPFRCAVRRRA